jgi:hypothetical protein
MRHWDEEAVILALASIEAALEKRIFLREEQ